MRFYSSGNRAKRTEFTIELRKYWLYISQHRNQILPIGILVRNNWKKLPTYLKRRFFATT